MLPAIGSCTHTHHSTLTRTHTHTHARAALPTRHVHTSSEILSHRPCGTARALPPPPPPPPSFSASALQGCSGKHTRETHAPFCQRSDRAARSRACRLMTRTSIHSVTSTCDDLRRPSSDTLLQTLLPLVHQATLPSHTMAITQDGGGAGASGSLSVDEETDLALLVSSPYPTHH